MTYNVEETEVEGRNTISTGNIEIDRRIGGGIPYGTLMLIEGDDASGKSSITQQLFYGALKAGEDVVCYSTETTIQSLIPQMKSIGMDCTKLLLYALYPDMISVNLLSKIQLTKNLTKLLPNT